MVSRQVKEGVPEQESVTVFDTLYYSLAGTLAAVLPPCTPGRHRAWRSRRLGPVDRQLELNTAKCHCQGTNESLAGHKFSQWRFRSLRTPVRSCPGTHCSPGGSEGLVLGCTVLVGSSSLGGVCCWLPKLGVLEVFKSFYVGWSLVKEACVLHCCTCVVQPVSLWNHQ